MHRDEYLQIRRPESQCGRCGCSLENMGKHPSVLVNDPEGWLRKDYCQTCWAEMKDVLPLLSDKKYYKDLRYGYARGSEPVDYVTRIRSYNELLLKHFGRENFDSVK